MAVITVSREFGSEGSLVAEQAARALGYHLADKAILEDILRADYAASEFEQEYKFVPGFWDKFDVRRMERRQVLIDSLNKAIMALAQHGHVVIVGRGGFSVLKNLSDVLHVRVQAPLPLRIRRVAELPEVGEAALAEQFVLENDRIQKGFIESVYGVPWDSARAFDLVLDTGKIPAATAADWLVQAARNLDAAPRRGSFTAAGLEVDHLMALTVNRLFKCEKVAAS